MKIKKGKLNYDQSGRAYPPNPRVKENWSCIWEYEGKYYKLVGDNEHKEWDEVKANELAESVQQDFIKGANCQSKRMYSEEDMAEAFIACWKVNVPNGIECKVSFNEWFEQFKKK